MSSMLRSVGTRRRYAPSHFGGCDADITSREIRPFYMDDTTLRAIAEIE